MAKHKLSCPAYSNYQPPYADCDCGTDHESDPAPLPLDPQRGRCTCRGTGPDLDWIAESVETWPEAMLVTPAELTAILNEELAAARLALQRAMTPMSIHDATAKTSPFEYDQGDTVRIHFDDLYDLTLALQRSR